MPTSAWATGPTGTLDSDLTSGLADDVEDTAQDRMTGGSGTAADPARDWFLGQATTIDLYTDYVYPDRRTTL